jgi:phage terminase large subunit-like protein
MRRRNKPTTTTVVDAPEEEETHVQVQENPNHRLAGNRQYPPSMDWPIWLITGDGGDGRSA